MKEMIADLIKAQKELRPILKRGKNPHFHSDYAEYEDVVEEAKRVLNINNMFIAHMLGFEGDRLMMKTRIYHSSGEFLESQMPIINKMGTDQGLGSSITYTKRYSLEALIGASSQKDDDGNAATGNEVPAAKKAGPKLVSEKKQELSEAQIKRLFAIAGAHKWTNERVREYIKFKYSVESTKDLTWGNYELLIKAIEATPK